MPTETARERPVVADTRPQALAARSALMLKVQRDKVLVVKEASENHDSRPCDAIRASPEGKASTNHIRAA